MQQFNQVISVARPVLGDAQPKLRAPFLVAKGCGRGQERSGDGELRLGPQIGSAPRNWACVPVLPDPARPLTLLPFRPCLQTKVSVSTPASGPLGARREAVSSGSRRREGERRSDPGKQTAEIAPPSPDPRGTPAPLL